MAGDEFGDEFEDCPEAFGDPSLPTYTSTDGVTVAVDCGDDFIGSDDGFIGGGFFAVFFVLVVLSGIAMTVWRVSTARRMARQAGMSEDDAVAMTLLSDQGFEATYLASNLRPQSTPAPAGEPTPDAATRLRELQGLKDEGLITETECAERRQAILGEI